MATTRRTRKAPSTTTRKSSEPQTEKPQSDSQASEKESDETSTRKGTSSSSPSSEDENEALFAEADEKAAQEPEEDADEAKAEDDADEPKKGAQDVVEGEVRTFEVDPGYGRPYTFKGVVNGNTIVVTEDANQEFQLPGSKKTGWKMAHHKGQLLPLSSFERFIKGE